MSKCEYINVGRKVGRVLEMGRIDQSPHAGVKGEFVRKEVPLDGTCARVGSSGPEEEGLDLEPDSDPDRCRDRIRINI